MAAKKIIKALVKKMSGPNKGKSYARYFKLESGNKLAKKETLARLVKRDAAMREKLFDLTAQFQKAKRKGDEAAMRRAEKLIDALGVKMQKTISKMKK